MSTVNIDLSSDTQLNMILGQQDETEVREVVFDFSDWYTTYGSGTISLSVQRSKDQWPYEVELTVDNTNHTATWTITDTDTGYAGVGMVQITYTVGTAKKKSVVYRFTVYKSLGATGNVITPVQLQTWMDEVDQDIADIKQDLEELQNDAGVTAELKSALLDIAENIAYINENGQNLYDNLYNALYPQAQSITCVYTQSGTVYTTDTLNSLKDDLVVTAHYYDSTTKVLKPSDYTLTGTLTAGTSTITVHYGNLVATFTVTVTARTLSSISAVYTQSGEVYTFTPLDDLKADLVVTAIYNDSTTEVVNEYTLSGTLAIGTSTVTVTYENKTTTFGATVVECSYQISDLTKVTGALASNNGATCKMSLNRKTSPNAYRRSFVVGEGMTSIALSYTNSDNIESQTSEYYPLRIPKGSSKVTINVTPSTQYVQALMRYLEDGVYSTMAATAGTTGYQLESTWKEYETVTGDSFIFITTKYDNAGTSYPTEPTGLDIVFE